MPKFQATWVSRAIAAYLFVASAAIAQELPTPIPAKAVPAESAVTAAATSPTSGGDAAATTAAAPTAVVPSESQAPFVTAPSIKPNVLNSDGLVDAGYGRHTAAAVAATPGSPAGGLESEPSLGDGKDLDNLMYLIAPNLIPSPLNYSPNELNRALTVVVPTPSEVKLLLPGAALDAADEARYQVSQFMGNLTGSAAQLRNRQNTDVVEWGRVAGELAKQLTANPWQVYQFHRVAQKTLREYRVEIKNQSKREAELVALVIKPVIERIGLVMPDMPTQQAKLAWYNVMVQLKENFSLYQAQLTAGDSEVLGELKKQLDLYPAKIRPAGEPPLSPAAAKAKKLGVSDAAAPASADQSDTVKKPAATLDPKSDKSSSGLWVALVMALLTGGFMLRQRLKKKKLD